MWTTVYVVGAFVLGAAIGSIVTYYNCTWEKTAIFSVRSDMKRLSGPFGLTEAQYRKIRSSTEPLVSDKEVLDYYRWAKEVRMPTGEKYPNLKRMKTTRLAAAAIICEKSLGMRRYDAIRIMLDLGSFDEIPDRLKYMKANS